MWKKNVQGGSLRIWPYNNILFKVNLKIFVLESALTDTKKCKVGQELGTSVPDWN